MPENPTKCIYCGERDATERDHVPPQSFFPHPRPSNLITVPSCSECNRAFGKIDERMRNILTSLESTEDHPAIISQLAGKRYRSLARPEGITNLDHIVESIKQVDVYTPANLYVGTRPAFNLDQRIVYQFLNRTVRALLYIENNIKCFDGRIDWRLSYSVDDFQNMPTDLKSFLANPSVKNEIGDDIFFYAGWFLEGHPNSLWALGFYGGVEFLVTVMHNK